MMRKKIPTLGLLALSTAFIIGCANKPAPILEVTTIPQPNFNISMIYAESPVVSIPPQEQTVVCNGCDILNTGVNQDDDVIWVRLVPQTPPVKEVVEETIVDSKHFDFDKAILKGDLSKLSVIVQKLKENPEVEAQIVGHTDSTGSQEYNLKLGLKRAEAVKRWLVSQGIESSRIVTDTKGKSEPIASNRTKEGRAKNRRAVLTVHVTG